jgi:uncharacterized protein (TIGR04255 family)
MPDIAYTNSPIREAVFDIRFKFATPLTPAIFEDAYKTIEREYPKKEVNFVQSVEFEIKPGENPKVKSETGPNGLRAISEDGTRIVQFRVDGFSFNKLRPYTNWETFSKEARKLLEIYLALSKPDYAERIALRYINAIEIPESNFKLQDYFLTAPNISENLPQSLIHFFMRLIIKDSESNSFATINQTIENSGKKDSTTILFDIDVFQPNTHIEPDLEKLFTEVFQLKDFRTRVFERSLTAKTKSLFT